MCQLSPSHSPAGEATPSPQGAGAERPGVLMQAKLLPSIVEGKCGVGMGKGRHVLGSGIIPRAASGTPIPLPVSPKRAHLLLSCYILCIAE